MSISAELWEVVKGLPDSADTVALCAVTIGRYSAADFLSWVMTMSEASRSKTHRCKTHTTNILRPAFGRWLPAWLKSANVADGKCQVVRLEVKAETHDTQPVSTSIATCKRDVALLASRQVELASSLQDCRERGESISARAKRATELRKVAAERLSCETTRLNSAKPNLLRDSYLNFEMRDDLLNEKYQKFLQEFENLERQQRQVSVQLESQKARLCELEAMIEDSSFKRAA